MMRRPAVPPVPEPEIKGAEPRVRVLRVLEENTGTAVRFRFRPEPGCFTGLNYPTPAETSKM